MAKRYILDQETAYKKLQRMAYEILENNLNEKQIILIGIRENGSVIAGNMQALLKNISDIIIERIDLSLDKKEPKKITLSSIPDFNGKVIIVVDDVANSGKTLLYSMKPLLEFHPKKIQTLALVERTHKAFPIKPDYVGLSVATTFQDHIYVEVNENEVKGAWME